MNEEIMSNLYFKIKTELERLTKEYNIEDINYVLKDMSKTTFQTEELSENEVKELF
jgi:hypothetical protein